MAQPVPPGLNSACPPASATTPAMPSARPAMRVAVSRSPSHQRATSAPNRGELAFRIAASPVLIDCTAHAYSANGSAEFSKPTTSMPRQCWRDTPHKLRSHISGSRHSAASATRAPAVGMAPTSAPSTRMNKKDAPHTAASNTNSPSQGGVASAALAVAGVADAVDMMVAFRTVQPWRRPRPRLPAPTGGACGPARRRSPSTRRWRPARGGRARSR